MTVSKRLATATRSPSTKTLMLTFSRTNKLLGECAAVLTATCVHRGRRTRTSFRKRTARQPRRSSQPVSAATLTACQLRSTLLLLALKSSEFMRIAPLALCSRTAVRRSLLPKQTVTAALLLVPGTALTAMFAHSGLRRQCRSRPLPPRSNRRSISTNPDSLSRPLETLTAPHSTQQISSRPPAI